MKKSILMFGALALLFATSCKEKETVETTTQTNDTIVVEAPSTETTTTTTTETVEDSDGTSVSVNSTGVSVDSKDGTKKTEVNISKEGGAVEIKK